MQQHHSPDDKQNGGGWIIVCQTKRRMKDPLSTHPSTVKPADTSGQERLRDEHNPYYFRGSNWRRGKLGRSPYWRPRWGSSTLGLVAWCPFKEWMKLEVPRPFTNGAHSLSADARQPPQPRPSSRSTDFVTMSGKKKTVSRERRLAFLIPLLVAIITENVFRVACEQFCVSDRTGLTNPPSYLT